MACARTARVREPVWVYNGAFRLVDAWAEQIEGRRVFKFRLEVDTDDTVATASHQLNPTRLIPTDVKLEVWKRDGARCVRCGSTDNLHFDHIIPWFRGGSSLTSENIQLLCVKHNLEKHDRIE